MKISEKKEQTAKNNKKILLDDISKLINSAQMCRKLCVKGFLQSKWEGGGGGVGGGCLNNGKVGRVYFRVGEGGPLPLPRNCLPLQECILIITNVV